MAPGWTLLQDLDSLDGSQILFPSSEVCSGAESRSRPGASAPLQAGTRCTKGGGREGMDGRMLWSSSRRARRREGGGLANQSSGRRPFHPGHAPIDPRPRPLLLPGPDCVHLSRRGSRTQCFQRREGKRFSGDPPSPPLNSISGWRHCKRVFLRCILGSRR